ncbi:MAG: MarR family transcriptional regulator [Suipraeoptans sp.]
MDGFFAGESIPVNKKLSEIFLQLHISEKTGRGVPRITHSYGKGAYEFRENAIVVKIPFNWINVMGDKVSNKVGDKPADSPLTNTQYQILLEIRNNPNITKTRLMELLSVGKTTVDNGITALKKYGFIERIGSNKTGYWKVVK